MTPTIDIYFSFRSPYSYLATPELLKIAAEYRVALKLKPVLPVALRARETLFNESNGQMKVQYILLDVLRRAEFLGMSIQLPQPDPIVQDMQTLAVAEHQPYIHRLTALGVEAEHQGRGMEFAHAVSHLIWGGTNGWDQGDHLKNAVASAGLDLEAMERRIEQYDVKQEIELNQAQLEQSGHWGVPTMVFNNEPFFGQDRIDTLRWRLDQHGLKKQGPA